MAIPILQIWDEALNKYVPVPAVQGPKGDTGPAGPRGPAGSDASVTASSIAGAMGLSGLSAGDQIAVDTVGADGRPASWKKKARDVLNVKDFGAKGGAPFTSRPGRTLSQAPCTPRLKPAPPRWAVAPKAGTLTAWA